jgi:hypothetical protein
LGSTRRHSEPIIFHVTELSRVIRPAAVVPEAAANKIIRELTTRDVSRGGVWNPSTTVWQRYNAPWDGPGGTRGSSFVVGTIAVAYGMPVRDHITIYRVTVTDQGNELGWTVDQLCDEALGFGDLSLAICPRADLAEPPRPDPFRARRGQLGGTLLG